MQISSHEGEYLDAVRDQRLAHGGRNRAAHEGANAQVDQMHRSLDGGLILQSGLGFGHDASGFHLGEMKPLGGIEDRRDPSFKKCKSRLHL